MLEQVTDLVHRKMIKQLPDLAWEMLHTFEFSEGEEAIQMLREYLESANGRNAMFLEQLRQEGVCRHMLLVLNELGAVLIQTKPIRSSAVLLAAMIALVQSHGTSTYSAEALQEVDNIQLQLAEDLWKQFFRL